MITGWSLTIDTDGEREYVVTTSEPDASPTQRTGQMLVVGQMTDPFAFYRSSNYDDTEHRYSTRAREAINGER